jgi:hypothetical protein
MYVLDHKLKMHPLRLADPNDDLGGVLYPSVPADIVHLIDHHSVLSPRKFPLIESSNGLTLRSIDSHTGNRDEIVCPICGEAYGTYKRLRKHIEYNAMIEESTTTENFTFFKGKSHIGFILPKIEPLTLEEVRNHIEHTLSEIIVVVEAIDPQLSGTFQSLQSYKYNDIVFGAEFTNCMSSKNGVFCVDMKRFHKTCNHQNSNSSGDTSSSIHSTDSSINNSNNNNNSSSNKQKSTFAGTRNELFLSNISEGTYEDSNEENDGGGDDDNDDEDDDDDDHDDDDDEDEENINYFRRSYSTFESSTRHFFWRDSKPTIV